MRVRTIWLSESEGRGRPWNFKKVCHIRGTMRTATNGHVGSIIIFRSSLYPIAVTFAVTGRRICPRHLPTYVLLCTRGSVTCLFLCHFTVRVLVFLYVPNPPTPTLTPSYVVLVQFLCLAHIREQLLVHFQWSLRNLTGVKQLEHCQGSD